MRVAIVGAGWAGLAAAMAATRGGHEVTLFEASRQLGGRARRLLVDVPGHGPAALDNGQHILIGAYRETLGLMRLAGIDPARVLHRLPLTLRFPDGGGLELPDAPAPWDAALGILRAEGWTWGDKASLLSHASRWRLRGFRCHPQQSVAELCEGMAPRVLHELVEPLCVAALNVPAQRASAAVFLRVLQDGLFGPREGSWAASNLLLAKVDLGALFPDAASAWLQSHGVQVHLGVRVRDLARSGEGWQLDGEAFDAVVLACPAWEAARLAEAGGADGWVRDARALGHEAIATVYATGGPRLALPMLALRAGPAAPAQFVFDRSQLGGPTGLLAFVVSASAGDAATLERQVLQQARALGWAIDPLRTVVEKRATFACVPGLRRPGMQVAPGLLACGDYVEGPYPATLEGAVRSALAAVSLLPAKASPPVR